ncbi:hypothetical protein [Desulfomarina sp.]
MKKEYDLYLPFNGRSGAELLQKVSAEQFFRLNPHWNIKQFSLKQRAFSLEGEDHGSGTPFVFSGTFVSDNTIVIEITDHYWHRIIISGKGSTVSAQVFYSREPSEDEERHVVLWLRSIKEYLRLYLKTNPVTLLFRTIMDRIILKMNPSQRKISLMIIRITIVELFVILLIIVGYVFFMK